jgi:hypothetical protein
MKDLPGGAALRKLHGQLREMHGAYCSAMKEIEQPKVRGLLEKLTGHLQDHIDRVGECFGNCYPDHNQLDLSEDKSAEVREGAPGVQDQYEGKDATEVTQRDIDNYDKNPATSETRHPEGWQTAPGGAREHGGRFPQATTDNRHPEGWQQAHGGSDNGNRSEDLYEMRNPQGRFRRPAAMDEKTYTERLHREIFRKAKFLGLLS